MKTYESHGMAKSSIYIRWLGIKNRCYNKSHQGYKNYGGRGISICSKWKNSFIAFYKDMGDIPFKGATIDRINNDKDYKPGNVRWSTRSQQQFNRRIYNNGTSKYKHVYLDKRHNSWVAKIEKPVRVYLGSYRTEEKAHAAVKKFIKQQRSSQ